MRFATFLVAIALASWGTSIRAQAIGFGHPSLLSGPSFHIPSSAPIGGPLLLSLQGGSFGSAPKSQLGVHARPSMTCPMPVVHGDSGKGDPMPVAKGGLSEPMPVAKADCWNPLDRRP